MKGKLTNAVEYHRKFRPSGGCYFTTLTQANEDDVHPTSHGYEDVDLKGVWVVFFINHLRT